MAKKSGIDQRLYVGGYDLSGDVGAINSCDIIREPIDVTAINVTSRERIQALADGMIDFGSFFNDANDRAHEALSGVPSANEIVLWALGSAIGDVGFAFEAVRVQRYNPQRARTGALDINTRSEAEGVPVEDVVMLTAADDTHASATSNASVDQAASSAVGAVGYCIVLSIGSGTPTFIMQDSANDSTFATLISFGAQATQTAARSTVTGTVNRYVRATTTGTFTNAQFVMAMRRGTAQDIISLA